MSISKELVALLSGHLDKIITLRSDFSQKPDGSYVSKGDLLVQDLVLNYLKKALPDHQLISEEMAPFTDVLWNEKGSYVVLDPIDGTENFVSGPGKIHEHARIYRLRSVAGSQILNFMS